MPVQGLRGQLQPGHLRVLQHSQENAAGVSHSAARAEEALGARGTPSCSFASVCVCVCVFTPQFAMKTQHCFGLGSQLEDAACCLLSSLHRAWGQLDTGLWEWGHARIFLAMFQTCISPEAFPSHSTTLHN